MTNAYSNLTTIPKLGDICKAKDLGFSSSHGSATCEYVECPGCHNQRLVFSASKKRSKTGLCKICYQKISGERLPPQHRGEHSPAWKGGLLGTGQGYMQRRLFPSDFFYPMANKIGYVLEHRLVMAKHLGRNLHRWKIVHHKNHIRDDNRIENLQLVSDDRHMQITILETRIKHLEERVTMLEAEKILLEDKINEQLCHP